MEARENQLEAAEYEQGLKKRPNAFVVQLWQEKIKGVMQVWPLTQFFFRFLFVKNH